MASSLPPLNWFRAFESAAHHLSFTSAAGELNITQSAVSQHVRSLELRLGKPLFVRKASVKVSKFGTSSVPSFGG